MVPQNCHNSLTQCDILPRLKTGASIVSTSAKANLRLTLARIERRCPCAFNIIPESSKTERTNVRFHPSLKSEGFPAPENYKKRREFPPLFLCWWNLSRYGQSNLFSECQWVHIQTNRIPQNLLLCHQSGHIWIPAKIAEQELNQRERITHLQSAIDADQIRFTCGHTRIDRRFTRHFTRPTIIGNDPLNVVAEIGGHVHTTTGHIPKYSAADSWEIGG